MSRVDGNLALSRAFGDFEYKDSPDLPVEEQAVTVCPDVSKRDRNQEDQFIVVACDGIWDCKSSQQVVDHYSSCLRLIDIDNL